MVDNGGFLRNKDLELNQCKYRDGSDQGVENNEQLGIITINPCRKLPGLRDIDDPILWYSSNNWRLS
jgi:hypothetical protein